MKNFIYLIIAVILSITLISAVQKTNPGTKNITLQSTVKNVDPGALNKSAEIIASRLKQFGINSADVKVSVSTGQIKVMVPDNTDLSDIEVLIISSGSLAFYETYTHSEITDLLKPDNQLFRFLNSDQSISSSDPRVGCANDENHVKADKFLQTFNTLKNCRLLWGSESKKSANCLFALKTNEGGKSLLTRLDIESVKIANMADNQGFKIQIKLNAEAAKVFAEATRINLNKSIAIIIDDRVYSWPRVQNVIEGGEVEITGDFTEKEAKFYPVIFNTAQLPLSFKILK